MSGTDYTLTPNLGLYKPTVNADSDVWGNHWNINADKLDTTIGTGGPFLPLTGGQMSGDIAPYFGTGSSASPIDLITSHPPSGIYQTAGASNIQAEPILGPFWGKDFTRAQAVSYLTTTLGSGVGEYGHLFNLTAATGFPSAWQANHAYLLHETVANGGNNYSVTTAGTSAASGGPTGTGASISDGTVVWMYQAAFQQANGGKINLGIFSYADTNSGPIWGIANDLQISAGTNKILAFAQEIDLNNYRMDYATGPGGPSAVALQIFAGGPHRSSMGISIGSYGTPSDAANLVYGMVMLGSKLVSDVDVWLQTSAATSLKIEGTRANGTAIYLNDTSSNAIIISGSHSGYDIWATDNATTVFKVNGTHTNVVDTTGATISGVSWTGAFSATSINNTPIGATTPSTGAFTTLGATGTVSGAGFANLFASPPAIGGTAPSTGSFTGVNLGSAVAPGGAADLSRHIALYGTTVGFSVSAGGPNYNAGSGDTHKFFAAGTQIGGISATGLTIPGISVTGSVATAYQDGGTHSSATMYLNDTSPTAVIIAGNHSSNDIWITDNAPNVLSVGGTHTNVVNISGTITGVTWSGPFSVAAATGVTIGTPTIRSGTGAATGTQPSGSLWLRTDGAAGARLYVSAGAGTWTAVATV